MTGARRIAGEEAMSELVNAIGADAARTLARNFGGTTVYVPRNVGPHHILRVLDQTSIDRLVAWRGSSRLVIPKQVERRARVRELHRAGALTVAGIARETGYSERHVYRLVSEIDDRQLDLFE